MRWDVKVQLNTFSRKPTDEMRYTVYNIEISHNFLVRKISENAHFLQGFGWFARNYAETAFPQNYQTKKLGESTIFYAVV